MEIRLTELLKKLQRYPAGQQNRKEVNRKRGCQRSRMGKNALTGRLAVRKKEDRGAGGKRRIGRPALKRGVVRKETR